MDFQGPNGPLTDFQGIDFSLTNSMPFRDFPIVWSLHFAFYHTKLITQDLIDFFHELATVLTYANGKIKQINTYVLDMLKR